MRVIKIHIQWDEDARVWFILESDVPGLHAEAKTQKEMLEEIKVLIPELIKANGLDVDGSIAGHKQVPIELIASQFEHIALAC